MTKAHVVIIALVAAFLAAGAVIYGLVFQPDPERRTWIVSTLTGSVEVSLGGGAWQAGVMRQAMTDGDRIRTAGDGEVTLTHQSSHVTVRAATQVEVSQLSADSSRFQLTEGQIFVEARGDRVSMRTRSGAAMDARDAGVGMTVKPNGWAQVIVKRGSADFTGLDRTEHLKEGEEAHADAGGRPSKPAPIPDVLLLNVRFPDAETFRSKIAHVDGRADPGSRVRVGSHDVEVGADGTWSADVVLEEGINEIRVDAADSIGNTRTERSQPIRVDTMAPSLEGATIGSHSVAAGPGRGAGPAVATGPGPAADVAGARN